MLHVGLEVLPAMTTPLEDGVRYLMANYDLEDILTALGMEKRVKTRAHYWVKPFVAHERKCARPTCDNIFMAKRANHLYCCASCAAHKGASKRV